MPNFTTGEWKYEEYVPNGVTINGKEYIIYTGSVNPKEPGEDIALAKREADARLITAAPELFKELDYALAYLYEAYYMATDTEYKHSVKEDIERIKALLENF